MRKLVLAVMVLAALLLPVSARAQNEIVLQEVNVQLWPEYDQPSVLVIFNFSLSADAAFPVKVSFRIPATATLTAVAKDENGLITVPYEAENATEAWRTISLSVDGPEAYRLEYYFSFAKAGTTRSFSYTWPGDYAVRNLWVELQEPTEIKNLSTNPAMSNPFPSTNGMILHNTSTKDLAAGTTYTVDVQYDRSTDEISASNLSVQPSGGTIAPTQQSLSLTTVLPYALGGLGLLLIVGGGVWYWQSGRGTSAKLRKRHSHAGAQGEQEKDDTDDVAIYCHQCGRRAGPTDKFCRACGTRLRHEE